MKTPIKNPVFQDGDIPQDIQNSDYTFVIGDAGRHKYHDSASNHTYTIPSNASVPFIKGAAMTVVNGNGGGTITLSITSDTLRRGDGVSGTGSRTIAPNSIVTILKVKTTEWMISGVFT